MKKILVIDDAEFILENTSTILRFENYEVYTALNGAEGIESALKYKPDLILCDISMPGLDGYEVLVKLREHPETATTPFIFLTAFTEKASMRAGMEKGADDYLVKPYTRDELVAAIEAQWDKHSRFEKHVQQKVDEVGRSVTYALPHEFRTVLNEVIGSAKYLNSNAETLSIVEIAELTNDIINSANRLNKITENFLALIRIDTFSQNPQKRKQLRQFRTNEPAALICDLASITAQKHERYEDLLIQGDCEHSSIEISSESFYKIISELLDNAFRFSKSGSKITIHICRDNDFLIISIEDKGRGMSEDQITGIAALAQFERTIYEQQGAGLGLVIAKRLVELHDGNFDIKSNDDIGTIVTLSLPLAN